MIQETEKENKMKEQLAKIRAEALAAFAGAGSAQDLDRAIEDAVGHTGVLRGAHYTAQVKEIAQHMFKPRAGAAAPDGALLDLAHHAAYIHPQREAVAVNDDVSGAVADMSAYHQPRDAAHGGVGIRGDAGDGAGDGEVFNGARADAEQAAAAPFCFVDVETADGVSASVKGAVKWDVLVADGRPLHAGEVDVTGEGHCQVPLLLVVQLVDGMGKVDQLLCRADW